MSPAATPLMRPKAKASPRAPPTWSSRWRCRSQFKRALRRSSPSIMSSGRSSSASATGRIPSRSRGAATVITMTEEDFLKRWSRRKREAEVAKTVAPEANTDDADSRSPEQIGLAKGAEAPAPEFDPASLPPIDSITAVSDITAFLRAGVPLELTRAALRRVWSTDPAIRDFVGLAENAWDFTAPNAMPGFGPLESTEEVRRMIAQVIDRVGEAVQPEGEERREPSTD